MIYQSGYLTIKEFHHDDNSYLLDFPNEEVRTGFIAMMASGFLTKSPHPASPKGGEMG